MDYQTALSRIVATGVEAAERDYSRPDQEEKRDGSVAGFTACSGLSPDQLGRLLEEARQRQAEAHRERYHNYWWFACYAAEVDWVCNVVSCILVNEGRPPIIEPTCRGMLHADRILKGA